MAEESQQDVQQQEEQPFFNIEKIYARDVSLEVPNAPQIFLERESPSINIELQQKASQVEDGIFESVLTVTVTSKVGEKVLFLVEVAQAGVFQVRNVPDEAIEGLLGVTCPNILFPYAREAISDMVTRAGFPPVLLSPVNFEALYVQQKQQQAAQQADGATH